MDEDCGEDTTDDYRLCHGENSRAIRTGLKSLRRSGAKAPEKNCLTFLSRFSGVVSMTESDRPYWVALTAFRPFGPVRMSRLVRRFPSMERVFKASALELTEAGIEPEIASRFLQERLHIDPDALYR